jgi:hypothetical protein
MSEQADHVDPYTPARYLAGYRPLPAQGYDLINEFKVAEEQTLRMLDQLAERDDIDKRWLAIGRTRLQEAYMAIVRAIAQPTRLQL